MIRGNSSFATIAKEITQGCQESAGLIVQSACVFHPKSQVGYGQSGSFRANDIKGYRNPHQAAGDKMSGTGSRERQAEERTRQGSNEPGVPPRIGVTHVRMLSRDSK